MDKDPKFDEVIVPQGSAVNYPTETDRQSEWQGITGLEALYIK